MSEEPSPPPRPLPPRSIREYAGGLLTWFGPVRIISTVVAVAIVVGGGYWLVRSPSPPSETTLPNAAAATTTVPVATLPPPVTAPPTSSTTVRRSVVVHVAGAVGSPGIVRLDADARVHAAIEAAGGPAGDADLDGLNLAAPVADGQRIYVPIAGEIDPASVPSGGVAPATDGTDGRALDHTGSGPIDVNRASASELEILPGVGPATAAAIIDDRERNGPFASVDDLDRVPGIGPSKLAAIRDLVIV